MSNAYRSTLAGGGSAPVGDATAADVLTGKTFSGAVGSGVSGTMPNQGAVSGQATPSQPYTIPAGYHNGSGVVTASGGSITESSYGATPAGTVSFTADKDYPSGSVFFNLWPTNYTVEVDNVQVTPVEVSGNLSDSNLPIKLYKLSNTLVRGSVLKVTSTATNVNFGIFTI